MLYDKNIGIRKKVDLMEQLTKSEREIAILVMEGLTNKEIASKLFISVHTVKAHLEAIYEKLEVYNRVQAVTKSILLGLVDLGSLVK